MSRISSRFKTLAEQQRQALIVYIVAGDPEPGLTVPVMHALVEAGASAIELGVPFTDPEADGPVIQAGAQRALSHHITLANVLEMVREFRRTDIDTPVVLMGYLNPIERMGYKEFAEQAQDAGVDGTITVNLPPEEGGALDSLLMRHGIDPVYLLAPTTSRSRAELICSRSRGFVYYVSLKGVTGSSDLDIGDVARRMAVLRGISDLPIAVGFGIKDGESAAAVSKVADGVVVGAAVVGRMNDANRGAVPARVAELVREMRSAMDR